MTRLADFADAPLGAYVCKEGWLVVGDQAWTVEEWRSNDSCHREGRGGRNGRPTVYDDEAHRKDRDKHRRYRAVRRAVA